MSDPNTYTVGWICAIEIEYLAAQLCLDEEHPKLKRRPSPNDTNTYTLGKIAEHNVVIAALPDGSYGTSSAASVAINLLRSFPNIRIGLMVGIGGGAPSPPDRDIRLGDIVVSSPGDGKGGVFQYDFGKIIQEQDFQETSFLNQPPTSLRTAVIDLKVAHKRRPGDLEKAINSILEKEEEELREELSRPDVSSDRLYRSNFIHPPNKKNSCRETCGVDPSNLIARPDRTKRPHAPVVHYGLIASGNQLMKDALRRDELADKEKVLCFEMEAAGLMDDFPCLVIRGICDYSDTHKNDEWQGYAALAAGVYAKDLLKRVPPDDVKAEKKIADIVTAVIDVKEKVEDVSKDVHKLVHGQHDQENQGILNWLKPFDYAPQQHDHICRRQPGTGQWFLNSDAFQTWLTTDKQTLFCPGIPGAGKTVMTAIVINYIQLKFRGDESTGIGYIYCNFQRQEKAEDLLVSLLKQLAERQSSLPASVKVLYDRHQKDRTRPLFDEISETLQSVAAMYSRVFIMIDALDECHDSTRTTLLEEMFQLQTKTGANILATSRSIPEITEQFEGSTSLEVHAKAEDVRRYLDGNIFRLPKFVVNDPKLREEVASKIVQLVDGMFLLARLHLDSLSGKTSTKTIRIALEKLPTGSGAYDEAYEGAVKRIREQCVDQRDLAMKVLSWIVCARRPLYQSELEHALAVEDGKSQLDEDNIPRIMVEVCAGLVTVDEESSIIRLVHYTTQEYFERTQNHWFPDAEASIAKVCLTYLSFNVFRQEHYVPNTGFLGHFPLYEYAAENWGHHARKDLAASSEVMRFLESQANVESSGRALSTSNRFNDMDESRRQWTGLHLAAYFGLEKAANALIDLGSDPNSKDTHQPQRLRAARNYSRTPLSYAAEEGHMATVQLLLDRKAAIESKDNIGRTPLSYSAERGHEDTIQLLLDRNADIESKGNTGRTPLSYAAEKGHKATVQLLLDRQADIESKDDTGRTPLLYSAGRGHEATVQLLLDRQADTESKYNTGRTLLSYAAGRGHEGIVQLLLAIEGIDVNSEDQNGRTPLSYAAGKGHEGIVQVLLATEGIDVDLEDQNGQMLLAYAIENADRWQSEILLQLASHGAKVVIMRQERLKVTCETLEDFRKVTVRLQRAANKGRRGAFEQVGPSLGRFQPPGQEWIYIRVKS